MNNPWPKSNGGVPDGCDPQAIAKVRASYGVDQFTMAKWLGLTVTQLRECEKSSTWPESEKARQKLRDIAATEGVIITTEAPEPEVKMSLF